ncbi:MAG TPA: carboxyl transferase [Deltaproteobacteria bacterium]|nr:carboxyl transferase [Deltaproteobacteria bacterium]
MPFDTLLDNLNKRKQDALKQGGAEKVKIQHSKGRLTARERIDRLLDHDSFFEFGMLACSDMPGMQAKTPSDSLITGYGNILGRPIGIIASDFTVLASSNSRIYSKKAKKIREQVVEMGIPLVWLGESGGGRLPDIQGAVGIASLSGEGGSRNSIFPQYSNIRTTPWVMAVMGQCNGVPMWQACLSDFVVQVKGSTLSVSGVRALQKAIAATYTDEDMGGWKVHAEISGMADQIAEDEDDCFRIIKEFLNYMPSNNREPPPLRDVPEESGKNMDSILTILPKKRTRSYDMYRIIRAIVDGGTIFDLKPFFGKTIITCLARIDGSVVGFIANQPIINGGAMGIDALEKMTSFMCLCDSFNIPLIFLHDTPGFVTGRDAELKKVGAKVTVALEALAQVTVPKISIIIRKTYGQAMFNMCGPTAGPDFIVAWPTAEIGFLEPEIAADVAYGALSEEKRKELIEKMVSDGDPYHLAEEYYIQDIIDPSETRNYLTRVINLIRNSGTKGMGRHLLANWPTKF